MAGDPEHPDWADVVGLVEASPIPLVAVSVDGTVVAASPSAADLMGWATIAGRPITDFAVDEDRARALIGQVLEADRTRDLAFEVRHADGRRIPVTVATTTLRDEHGRTRAVLVGAQDTTDIERRMLETNSERMRLVLDSSGLGLWDCNIATDEAVVDDRFCAIVGYRREDLGRVESAMWDRLTHPDDLVLENEMTRAHLAGEIDQYDMELRLRHSDGHWVWVRDRGRVVEWAADGTPLRMTGTIEDITAARADAALRAEHEELLSVVLEHSPDPTVRFDRDMRIDYVNQRVVRTTGIPEAEWIGRRFVDMGFDPGATRQWIEHAQRVFDSGERVRFEFRADLPTGTSWGEASMSPQRGPGGEVSSVVATIRDVTRRHRAEEELLRLATQDSLTGLANRAAVADEVSRALQADERQGTVTGVLLIDLDRFKNVNDSLGHGTGDELLVAAASRMRDCMRPGDLIARTGGDEFVVVMRSLKDGTEAMDAARRLVDAFRDPFLLHGRALYTTASVGVATGTRELSDVVREADTAMYVAKAEGRDRAVLFTESLRGLVSARLSLEAELRQAVDRDELQVWFQPEVDLTTGAIVAMEALTRWPHADGGTRGAEHFMDIAEDTGLIVAMGSTVLARACQEATTWQVPRHPVTVRVNVSARQLAEPGLVDDVARVLEQTALDPRLLSLEITESALISSTSRALSTVTGLRALGVPIWLDDFGTRYASLTYLRDYPVDGLKIDRSFVTGIETSPQDRALVAGIIALARHLGVGVTAEGVETRGQAEVLRDLDCPSAQGFLFAEAMSPTAAAQAIRGQLG
jgi:diguanylate cyclase (GGDEF)-like protein/PAS domain S-box-containing protein